jgi:hypothetical protein
MVNAWYRHRSNWVPTSLHRVQVAPKKLHRTNRQFRKALSVCTEALRLAPRKVHPTNPVRDVVASVRSWSTKVIRSNSSRSAVPVPVLPRHGADGGRRSDSMVAHRDGCAT